MIWLCWACRVSSLENTVRESIEERLLEFMESFLRSLRVYRPFIFYIWLSASRRVSNF